MQPEFISLISIPEFFKNPPSMPISPNSFSISTSFSFANASLRSFFINVVFPAPKNPETISIFVLLINPPSFYNHKILLSIFLTLFIIIAPSSPITIPHTTPASISTGI